MMERRKFLKSEVSRESMLFLIISPSSYYHLFIIIYIPKQWKHYTAPGGTPGS